MVMAEDLPKNSGYPGKAPSSLTALTRSLKISSIWRTSGLPSAPFLRRMLTRLLCDSSEGGGSKNWAERALATCLPSDVLGLDGSLRGKKNKANVAVRDKCEWNGASEIKMEGTYS